MQSPRASFHLDILIPKSTKEATIPVKTPTSDDKPMLPSMTKNMSDQMLGNGRLTIASANVIKARPGPPEAWQLFQMFKLKWN